MYMIYVHKRQIHVSVPVFCFLVYFSTMFWFDQFTPMNKLVTDMLDWYKIYY